MVLPAPQLDARSVEHIIADLRRLAPFYVKEWEAQAASGAGWALLSNFAHLLYEVGQHLNQAPDKNLADFLDRLGITLEPAHPARVPITFALAPGTPQNVLIPARTQLAAAATATQPQVLFETEQNLSATPATLQAVYSIDPVADAIYRHPTLTENLAEGQVLAGENVQEHSLYLAHAALLALKGPAIITLQLIIAGGGASFAELRDNLSWEWWCQDHWVPSTIAGFKEASAAFPAVTTLKQPVDPSQDQIMVADPVGSDPRFPDAGLLFIDAEVVRYQGKLPNGFIVSARGYGHDSIPGASGPVGHPAGAAVRAIDPPLMVGPTLTTQGNGRQLLTVTLTKAFPQEFTPVKVHEHESLWLRCRTLRTPGLNQSTLKNLEIYTIEAKAKTDTRLNPEGLFHNDVPLAVPTPEAPIYPFGTLPRTYETFYLASSDAFSKTGALISLHFTIIAGGTGTIPVRQVQGIGKTFGAILEQDRWGITTVDKLLQQTPAKLSAILRTNPKRALNILEAARKEFYDKAGIAAPGGEVPAVPVPEDLMLSWEFWDGNAWQVIPTPAPDPTQKLMYSGTLQFTCPRIMKTAVNGKENYWIRVRIVSGNYGQEKFSFDGKTVQADREDVHPPIIKGLQIEYDALPTSLERCFTQNNLNLEDVTAKAQIADGSFFPFKAPEESQPCLYLGFDQPLTGGPLGIFFSLVEQDYPETAPPRTEWHYWNGATWAFLATADDTEHLTRCGLVQLVGPADFAPVTKFGATLYWLQANLNGVKAPEAAPATATSFMEPAVNWASMGTGEAHRWISRRKISKAIRTVGAGDRFCPDLLEVFHSQFTLPEPKYAPPPLLLGIFPNSAWALQAETVRQEILGSSNGMAGQHITLLRHPVISEAIWIEEHKSLTPEERQALLARQPQDVQEIRDEVGELQEVWVRWQAADDLLDTKATDRLYVLDRVAGVVSFGNGVRGKIPPLGLDNLKADYQVGGGSQGNVAAATITTIKTSVAGVEGATNWVPAGGGSDTEPLPKAMARGPQVLKHRRRALGREDFEWLVRQSFANVAKVRCLPTTDKNGASATGWVTVLIIPRSSDDQPLPGTELRQQVKRFLAGNAPNVVAAAQKLVVGGPAYVEVSVTASLFITQVDAASLVQNQARAALKQFLHPLAGGPAGEGWDFGQMACLSDIITVLENLPLIDHVDQVSLKLCDAITQDTKIVTSGDLVSMALPPYAMMCSGEHTLEVKLQPHG
jgi:hypothetical protein